MTRIRMIQVRYDWHTTSGLHNLLMKIVDDKQFNDALESTIKTLASRERYGVSNDVLQGLTDVPNVVPAVSCPSDQVYTWGLNN